MKKTNKKEEKIHTRVLSEAREFKNEFTERTLKLVTSGFGLVAALAWNEVIKETVEVYVKPLFGEKSGLLSLVIYAVIVTALVVFMAFSLSKIGFSSKKE